MLGELYTHSSILVLPIVWHFSHTLIYNALSRPNFTVFCIFGSNQNTPFKIPLPIKNRGGMPASFNNRGWFPNIRKDLRILALKKFPIGKAIDYK